MYDFDDIGIDVVEKGMLIPLLRVPGHFLIQRHLMRAWSLMQKLIFHDKNSFVIWILMFELKHCIPINLDVDYGMFTITVNLMT